MTPPSPVRIPSPCSTRATESPRLRACSMKCQSGGCHTGSFSLLCTARRPRGVSNFHVLSLPSLTRVLPLPVATCVVNSVSVPFFSQRLFSSRLTTRYGLSFGGSALSASWMSCCPIWTFVCTASSRLTLPSATMRITSRRKRRATRVSTKSQVESAVIASIPPTRYHATPPPCPKNRTVVSVS